MTTEAGIWELQSHEGDLGAQALILPRVETDFPMGHSIVRTNIG